MCRPRIAEMIFQHSFNHHHTKQQQQQQNQPNQTNPIMTSTLMESTNNELRLPLILRRRESIIQQKYDRTTVAPEDSAQEQEEQIDHENPHFGVLLTCLLSFLLYIQFSISFPSIATTISSHTITMTIFLFFVTSILFRRTVQEEVRLANVTALHLLPELVGLLVILLCYSGHPVAGIIVLLVGKLIMAGAVVVYCASVLLFATAQDDNKNDENDKDAKTLVGPV
jgi:hypothetical protein